ncbi:hypothetical protein PUN28_002599 [Cardiocondyla obscurior]|uniref:Uncharacterized protein n=1 Tax=Cardiocondyla obscurior TaxID=286306 RepID=A0AAW2GV32_9HYME
MKRCSRYENVSFVRIIGFQNLRAREDLRIIAFPILRCICISGRVRACAKQIARLDSHACESRDSRASVSRPRENWHAIPECVPADPLDELRFASESFFVTPAVLLSLEYIIPPSCYDTLTLL